MAQDKSQTQQTQQTKSKKQQAPQTDTSTLQGINFANAATVSLALFQMAMGLDKMAKMPDLPSIDTSNILTPALKLWQKKATVGLTPEEESAFKRLASMITQQAIAQIPALAGGQGALAYAMLSAAQSKAQDIILDMYRTDEQVKMEALKGMTNVLSTIASYKQLARRVERETLLQQQAEAASLIQAGMINLLNAIALGERRRQMDPLIDEMLQRREKMLDYAHSGGYNIMPEQNKNNQNKTQNKEDDVEMLNKILNE